MVTSGRPPRRGLSMEIRSGILPSAMLDDHATTLASPVEVAERALAAIAARGDDGVWISVTPRDRLLAEARDHRATTPGRRIAAALRPLVRGQGQHRRGRAAHHGRLPRVLHGADQARDGRDAPPRRRRALRRQDQPRSVRHRPRRRPLALWRSAKPVRPAYIVGGSSSGSGVAVAAGIVDFALGTDTAGSGRVPAAFNNIVGLKPSRGILSTAGVVPACPSLDCVSIFALTVESRLPDRDRGARL